MKRAQLVSVHGVLCLAYSLTGCQILTGLNDLEADRLGLDADGGATAKRLQGGMRSDSVAAAGATGQMKDKQLPSTAAPAAGSGGATRGGTTLTGQHPGGVGMGEEDAGAGECTTRISYGSAWIRPPSHADSWDDVAGSVTWDGSCQDDGTGNSFAQLSNGWRPFFTGRSACVIAIDVRGSCAPKTGCSTRVSYGADWLHPDGHPDAFDDVTGVVTTHGQCSVEGEQSYLTLSNGWLPHFKGKAGCAASLLYKQCGGLFANPVVATDCPDPGVLQDGERYVMACTSQQPELPLHVSDDLVHWSAAGSVFTPSNKPQWADTEFWAPEIQRVGDRYLAYFSARERGGELAIGVASASRVLGPYADSGAPLLRETHGAIEPHVFAASDGSTYLLWKGNSSTNAEPTQIKLQPLTADGLALAGSATTLLTSSEAWEGGQVHAPWLSYVDGSYYLFYTADGGEKASIAVARASSLTGPYTKSPMPSLTAAGDWVGPTTGSLVRAHDGDWALVFHAWSKEHIGQTPPGRQVLLTRVLWVDGWPTLLGAPSSLSQPLL